MAIEQERVRKIFNEGGAPSPAPLPDDIEELRQKQEARHAQAANALRAAALTPETAKRMARILREKGKDGVGEERYNKGIAALRSFSQSNPDVLNAGPSEPKTDPRIDTTPLPTGVERIDKAGQTVTRSSGSGNFSFKDTVPSLDELPPDHPMLIRKQVAEEGVDMQSGGALDFGDRASIALTPNIMRLRSNKMAQVMGEAFSNIPDDLPKFRYDARLGEFQILQPTEDDKFRWTSLDGTGIELGDLADLMDLGEIGSMVGAVAGTAKGTKVFNFLKGQGSRAAAGGLEGGTLGRFGGEGLAIIAHHMQTGEAPTYEELIELGWNGAKIEMFATVTGELGAGILRGAARRIQGGNIRGGTRPSDEALEEANVNSAQMSEDLRVIRDAVGREDFSITSGQATRSIEVLEDEASGLKNANTNTKRRHRLAQSRSDRTLREYINKEFSGDPKFLGDRYGTVTKANDAINTAGTIVVGVNEDGVIKFASKKSLQEGSEDGLKVIPDGDTWQVRGAQLEESLQGTGVGSSLYVAAKDEAERHGKVLASDVDVSQDALNVWKKMDGKEFGDLIWNKNVTRLVDGNGRTWVKSTDGNPVVQMQPRRPVTPTLLKEFNKTGRDPATGKFKARAEFQRFLRRPGRKELGTVIEEINANPFIKQDLKDAILKDYSASTVKKNKAGREVFNEKQWDEWKNQTSRVLEEVFTPEEMVFIRSKPHGLRQLVEGSKATIEVQRNSLAKMLGVEPGSDVLVDPSKRKLWNQFKSMESPKRRRVLRILDSNEMGDGVRDLFREELKQDLLTKTKTGNRTGYDKWLSENKELIQDVLPGRTREQAMGAATRGGDTTTYYQKLEMLGRMVRAKADHKMVIGSGAEANPTALGLARVLFGPLSRIQRFFTGARKGMVRSNSSRVTDLITDPDAIGELWRIKEAPVGSRIVSRFVQDTGLLPMFGFDEDTFDAENEQDRAELKFRVYALLNEELNNESIVERKQ